ncbi:MAG: bifunctional DNA primase/polymerase, partial [Actinomycetota bacterium]|nr:bifunctional DNA primase/polymerase [Actinomycetota bacterium]
PTGERSGLLVLDHDAYKPEAISREDLERKHGPIPKTLTVGTGRGGFQYLFLYPAGSDIRNSASELAPGLDVRGEGGYIAAPPSRTEGAYEWRDRSPRAAPPEWLLEAARGPYRASEGTTSENRSTVSASLDGEPIPEGQRNHELFRIAGSLRARGLELEALETELFAVNAARCTPPLEPSEVAGIARSVCRYPAGDATPEPDPETLEAVEMLFTGVLERLTWKGRSGPTDRAVYAALLMTARRYGRPSRGGVKVYLSVRALALAAGVSRPTAIKALDRLKERGLLYRSSDGRGTKAGALVLRVTQAFTTQPFRGCSTASGQPLRNHLRELLRLRWGPGRLGKLRALLLEVIAQNGETTLSVLSVRTGRRRYDLRRALEVLEARELVECSGETYRLVPAFAAALDNELEASGIKRSERLDKEKYERQREVYRDRIARRRFVRSVQREPEPDGYIEDLERVEPERNPEPTPVDTEPSTVGSVSSVSEVFSLARECFGLPLPEPSEPEPLPDKESPAVFLRSELRGVSGMRYREMLRRWKELGGKPETLEGAIYAGPYRFKRERSDFNQPYVYPGAALINRGAA